MFKSIITTGKTIGTLSAKAGKVTGRSTKRAALATAKVTVKGTKATGRGFTHLGQAIASEYRANKVRNVPVTDFPFEAMA